MYHSLAQMNTEHFSEISRLNKVIILHYKLLPLSSQILAKEEACGQADWHEAGNFSNLRISGEMPEGALFMPVIANSPCTTVQNRKQKPSFMLMIAF